MTQKPVSSSQQNATLPSRRLILKRVCAGAVALPLLQFACTDSDSTVNGIDAGDKPDANNANVDWASGGTSSMTGKASYPDPFSAAAASCVLVATTTEGPCTTASDITREDVSEEWTGLPIRLALRVVDSNCDPLANAVVKIWHTNIEGIYSGNTPNPGMCNENNQAYINADFFRGVQTTNDDGIVYFDTCFPGWYNGRAIHIHFQVKDGNTSYSISQLFFPETITEEIFNVHPEYNGYGQPNTVFSNDNVMAAIPESGRDALIFEISRMSDGAMLASKTVTVS